MAEGNPAGAVREEDAFAVARVAAWLREHAEDPGGLDGTPEVRQYAGGASNLTYLLRFPGRELVLRRPPAGAKAKSAHDMRREFTIQARLRPAFGYVPAMVAFCDDQDVLGSDFYVMEKLDGTILRAEVPDGTSLDPPAASALADRFLGVLAELHAVDPGEVELDELGRGAGYVSRQVAGWSDRYRRARTDNVGDYEQVMAWLDERQPADIGTCVIHNDFRLDNLVLSPEDPTRITGVLDWEMATLGDPLMDLGGAMAYWIQADDDPHFREFRRQPSDRPGMPTRWQLVQAYGERTGRRVEPQQWAFYEVFGLFRLGVIAQQIYYRFHHGQTSNPAYGAFLPVVRHLEQRCLRLIEEAGR